MKDARGLDVTTHEPAAVAVADDFAARLLRLDRGVEAILDAAKRWPETPIIQLYAAAFWTTARPTMPARPPPPICTPARHSQ
jgi:hypothetical protein